MKRDIRRSLVWIVLIGGLSILGFLAVRMELAADADRLEARLFDTMGVQVRGGTEFEFFPRLGASFADVAIMEGTTVLFAAKKMTVGIELLSLFAKELQVTTLHLAEPVLTVKRDRHGNFNLGKVLHHRGAESLPPRLLAGRGAVERGTLQYSDEASGTRLEFVDLGLQFEELRRDPGGQLSFTGQLRAARCRVNDIELQQVSGTLRAGEGVYRAEPLRFTALGGEAQGWLVADLSGAQPFYRTAFSAKTISLARLYHEVTGKELLDGTVSMQAELSSHGPGSIVEGLSGTVKISGNDIVVHGFDLDGFIEDYRKSRRVDLVDIGAYLFAGPVGALIRKDYEISGMYRNLDKAKRGTLETIVFNWALDNGMARTADVAFRTRENRVAFQGTVDLPRRRYADFTLGVLDQRGCAQLTEKITGPLADPTVKQIGLVQLLTGPVVGILSTTLKVLDPRECRPFYSGQVNHLRR